MEYLEKKYHKVSFVYMTGHAQEGDCAGCNRHRFNDALRNYCRKNGKILFDLGALMFGMAERLIYIGLRVSAPVLREVYLENILSGEGEIGISPVATPRLEIVSRKGRHFGGCWRG